MAKRRSNKNLIVGLTVAGMVLSVGVVAMATMQAAKRDPAVYVARAQAAEQAGNQKRAADLYWRAWTASRQADSAIEASRCWFSLGDIPRAIGMLNEAQTALSDEPALYEASIRLLLEIEAYNYPVAADLRDRSAALLALDPNNILGLVARAKALPVFANLDKRNPELAEEALQRAISLEPTNPHVAILNARRIIEKSSALPRDASYPEQLAKIGDEAIAVLTAALARHPTAFDLVEEIARLQLQLQRADTARDFLAGRIRDNEQDARLHQKLADVCWRLVLSEREKPADQRDAARIESNQALGEQHARRALELDPLLYDAYATAARLEVARVGSEQLTDDDLARYQRAFELIDEGLDRTVGAKSLRVMLADRTAKRVLMLSEGFDLAVNLFVRATNAKQRDAALAQARRCVERANTQYANVFLTAIMEGELALCENKRVEAITAFERADERIRNEPGIPQHYQRMIQTRLAHLYRQAGEDGLALTYTRRAISAFESEGLAVPILLWTNAIEILLRLDDYQGALNMADLARQRFPDHVGLKRLRGAALVKLGRAAEAESELGDIATTDTAWLMFSARQAAASSEWAKAEELLDKVLEAHPDSFEAIGLYVSIMSDAGRNAVAESKLKALRASATDERLRRQIDLYLASLTAATPAERDERMKEVIAANSDPVTRAAEYFTFYAARGDDVQAAKYLDDLEKARPDDPFILLQQFTLNMRRGELARAEEYTVKLARLNVDHAGGATYRGKLKLTKGDPEGALAEFYAAQRTLPGNSELQVWIAQTLLSFKPQRAEEALTALLKAVEYDPKDFQANRLLFALHEQLGRRREGIAYLERAAGLRPDDPFIKQNMQLLEEERDPRAGIAKREQFRQQNPRDIANLIRLGELYAKIATDARLERADRAAAAERAAETFAAAAEIEPGHAALNQAAAQFFAETDQLAAGQAFLRRGLESREGLDQINGWLLLGRFLERLGDHEAAAAELQRADELAQAVSDPAQAKLARTATSMELVRFYSRREEYDLLPAIIERALSVATDPQAVGMLRLSLFDGYLRTKQFGKAADALRQFSAENPEDPRGFIGQAQLQMSMPQPGPDERQAALTEARELVTRVLQKSPDLAMALYLRGVASLNLARGHGQKQFLAGAIEDLRRAKQLSAQAFGDSHRVALIDAYDLAGNVALAEAELKELIDLSPDTGTALSRLITFYRSHGQINKAQEYFTQRATRDPANPVWSHQLGVLLMEGGEYSAAVRPLGEAMQKYEQQGRLNTVILTHMLEALTRGKRAAEGASYFEKLNPQTVTPRMRALAADCYVQLNQHAKAMEQLEAGLAVAVQSGPADLSTVAVAAGRLLPLSDAASLFDRALSQSEDKPGHAMLQVAAATFLIEDSAQRAKGVGLAENVISRAPAGSLLQLSAYQVRARARELDGRNEDAVEDLKRILEFNQNHVEALNNLAYKLADDLGRPAEALPYAERLRAVLDEGTVRMGAPAEVLANAFDTIGYVYTLADKLTAAESILLEALRLDPSNVPARLHLGQLYLKLGRAPDGRRLLEQARDQAQRTGNRAYLEKIEAALRGL
ncbi:MAG: tetratricopeptide repeat protein [Phycisphaerae bacterium]|nr:tetratricopeptide repeat protein [Phycisphaerae bacterium]MCZ2399709.1 tetratricopeptide repeat protein [Phycisphaerae bacterium]